MANVFSRSWQVTKLSFSVIKKDKEMLMFPLLGGLFSILFVIAMIFPTIIFSILTGSGVEGTIFVYLSLFVIYFGLAFIGVFFNTCTVYMTARRISGKDPTFKESIKFGFSRIHVIFLWSLLSATVGLFFRLLENVAERLGPIGEIVALIIISILGMTWSVITVFVVPSMVYYDTKPINSIKKSVHDLKKTWGESLIRYFGLGLIEGLIIFVGLLILIPIVVLMFMTSPYLGIVGILLCVVYFIGVIMLFTVANTVFNTILFVYAESGKVPMGFDSNIVANAFTQRKRFKKKAKK